VALRLEADPMTRRGVHPPSNGPHEKRCPVCLQWTRLVIVRDEARVCVRCAAVDVAARGPVMLPEDEERPSSSEPESR
jgi:hypothetical protein